MHFALLGWTLLGFALAVLAAVLILAYLDEYSAPSTYYFTRSGKTVKVLYRSRVARALKWLTRGRVYGFPFWRRVYFVPNWSRLTRGQIAHEVHHCQQWEDYGFVFGLFLYLKDLCRIGYVWHPMELEARTVAQESLGTV